MPDNLLVGLVGCGWIAELAHIPSLERTRNATLVAVAETDATRRSWIRDRLPAMRIFEDAAELLEDDTIRAVVIAVPTAHTAPLAQAAFRAGKHVYVEKPGARSTDEWLQVVDAWSESGRSGVVGYNFRHNPIYLDAIRRVREGALGRIIALQTRFIWAADRVEGWRAATATGGGVLLDLASHHVDLVSHLLEDDPTEVCCSVRSIRVDEDAASLSVGFRDGVSAQVLVSSAGGANENRLTVVGAEGVLDVDMLDARPAPIRCRPGRAERARRALTALRGLHPARLMRSPGREPSFERALEGFVEGVLSGDPVRPDPADGLRVLRVIDAARASARDGGAPVAVAADPR